MPARESRSKMPSSRRLRLSPEAQDDIRQIQHYTGRTWGPDQEAAYAAALDAALKRIAAFPHIGRARDDLDPGCRALPVRHHLVYYRVDEAEVTVARILHEKLDPRGRL